MAPDPGVLVNHDQLINDRGRNALGLRDPKPLVNQMDQLSSRTKTALA
jgi:hypothetical protein